MAGTKYSRRQPSELRALGVRMVREHRANYSSDEAAYASISAKLGCTSKALRTWCIQAERNVGKHPGWSKTDKARIRELEREAKELRTTNEILRKASAFFAQTEFDGPFRK